MKQRIDCNHQSREQQQGNQKKNESSGKLDAPLNNQQPHKAHNEKNGRSSQASLNVQFRYARHDGRSQSPEDLEGLHAGNRNTRELEQASGHPAVHRQERNGKSGNQAAQQQGGHQSDGQFCSGDPDGANASMRVDEGSSPSHRDPSAPSPSMDVQLHGHRFRRSLVSSSLGMHCSSNSTPLVSKQVLDRTAH